MSRLNHIAATADVGSANGGAIAGVVLSPGSAVATLTLKEGGSGGTTILVLTAAANGDSVVVDLCEAEYHGQLNAALSGTGATANVALV